MDLNEISVFVKVVQTGGFVRAAQALGMPKSTVSARVAGLEQHLGVTLLSRTTRSMRVTEAGEAFYQQCSQALQELEHAAAAVTHQQATPKGLLRVTAPQEFAGWVLPRLSSAFAAAYPGVELDWVLTDQRLDLLDDNIDVAIRAGNLADSSLMARRVGQTHFGLFASADYLAPRPPLGHPTELGDHVCLRFTAPSLRLWELMTASGEEHCSIEAAGPVRANSITLVKALAQAGEGIALLPIFLCQGTQDARPLVRVLPQWSTLGAPVHLLYTAQKFMPPKLDHFLDMAERVLKDALAC